EFGQSGQRQHAIELPCAIAPLVTLYDDSGLLECKTEECQTKWHADSKLAKNCFPLYNSFFFELVDIQAHLEDFSLCEMNSFDSNYVEISKNRQNKQKQTHIEYTDIKNNTYEIGIQTDNKKTSEIGVQAFDNISYTFESYIHLLEVQLNIKINEIEDLKKQLDFVIHKLYYVISEMQAEHELELKIYLSSIIEELVAEKNENFNMINQAVKNQKGTRSQSKWCKKCNTTNINNKKHNCPNCNEKLDTLAILRAEFAN
ncbi:19743_t:CDS:2, partial [Gigaspora margarita]